MSRTSIALGLLALIGACGGSEGEVHSDSDRSSGNLVAYDTVAIVGGVNETNPLFQYRGVGSIQLVDSTLVVWSDPDRAGRMVVADMISSEGWEIFSPRGADGPGELGGEQPWVFAYDGLIHGLTNQLHNVWRPDGELVSSRRHEQPWLVSDEVRVYAGMVGDRVVVRYWEPPSSPEWQELSQGLRIYDLERGLIAEVHDGIPRHVSRRVRQGRAATSSETRSEGALVVQARAETIAWAVSRQNRVTTLDPDGVRLASRELDLPIEQLFVDADQRLWARVAMRTDDGGFRNVVLDRRLEELFRLAASNVVDAYGDYVLALKAGDLDALQLVLLRMRRAD